MIHLTMAHRKIWEYSNHDVILIKGFDFLEEACWSRLIDNDITSLYKQALINSFIVFYRVHEITRNPKMSNRLSGWRNSFQRLQRDSKFLLDQVPKPSFKFHSEDNLDNLLSFSLKRILSVFWVSIWWALPFGAYFLTITVTWWFIYSLAHYTIKQNKMVNISLLTTGISNIESNFGNSGIVSWPRYLQQISKYTYFKQFVYWYWAGIVFP